MTLSQQPSLALQNITLWHNIDMKTKTNKITYTTYLQNLKDKALAKIEARAKIAWERDQAKIIAEEEYQNAVHPIVAKLDAKKTERNKLIEDIDKDIAVLKLKLNEMKEKFGRNKFGSTKQSEPAVYVNSLKKLGESSIKIWAADLGKTEQSVRNWANRHGLTNGVMTRTEGNRQLFRIK